MSEDLLRRLAAVERGLARLELQERDVTAGFHAHLSANQSINTATPTKVEFSVEDWDSNGNYDPSTNYRHTPSLDGKWLYIVNLRFNTIVAGQYIQISLFRNGTNHRAIRFYPSGTPSFSVVQLAAIVDLNGSTNYVEIFAEQNSGAAQNIESSAIWTRFMGTYLGNY
jgi:hypothetical protein